MAPPFPTASIELDYPLYALDFDPQDANRLVVGGGGGAGRSGVGNKITILETSTSTELHSAGEIELSRDEDSVMSLALGSQKGKNTFLYAGVNSNPHSIAKGKNEHLRTLTIEQSRARPSSANGKISAAKIAELSRTTMFTDSDENTYQRLLRIAGGIGAAATAMGKEPQLAIFEATGASPKARGVMELPREAEDLDIMQTGDNVFQLAFCYKYELHVVNIGKETSEPELIYIMPEENDIRPVFRSIRYLTPEFILAVSNLPNRNGVVIQALRLPIPGHENARVAATVRIPRAISATALAVTNLTPPTTHGTAAYDSQFIIGVAGHDSSISLYTLEQTTSGKLALLVNLHPLHTVKEAHGAGNITGLAFSAFVAPKTHLRPQFIKLASISLQKTVGVHTIPLKRLIDKTERDKKGPPKPARYVVAMKSKAPTARPLVIVLTIIVLIMALVGQSMMELYGRSQPIVHAHKFLPGWHGTLHTPDQISDAFIAKLLGADKKVGETIVIQHQEGEDVQVDIHHDQHAKEWNELSEEQKNAWREKLSEAGTWTKDMGESVFKGILFGELAGMVGRVVA